MNGSDDEKAMRTGAAQTLYSYWNDVRAGRLAPRRFDIEPARITALLPDTFILERTHDADLRYRLAGTRICEQFGSEFRGRSFFEGWSGADRASIEACTSRVIHDGGVALLTLEVRTATDRDVAALEMLLLPLTHTRGSIDRVLGIIAPLAGTAQHLLLPFTSRRLAANEIIWPEGRPHRLADVIGRQSPFPAHIRRARIVRADRRQFRVYDGGLSGGERE